MLIDTNESHQPPATSSEHQHQHPSGLSTSRQQQQPQNQSSSLMLVDEEEEKSDLKKDGGNATDIGNCCYEKYHSLWTI